MLKVAQVMLPGEPPSKPIPSFRFSDPTGQRWEVAATETGFTLHALGGEMIVWTSRRADRVDVMTVNS